MIGKTLKRTLRLALRRLPIDHETRLRGALEALPTSVESLMMGYVNGFSASGGQSGRIHWNCPPLRGIIPIHDYHIPKNVKRLMRQQRFDIRINTSFEAVLRECSSRDESWITPALADVFRELNDRGQVTTVESWQNDELVGGVFGVTIGGFYSGEASFQNVSDASKVAMIHLFKGLKCGGFILHDAQFATDYLKRYGACKITHDDYLQRLYCAISTPARFHLPAEAINNIGEACERKPVGVPPFPSGPSPKSVAYTRNA